VIAVPDPKWIEAVAAIVVLREGVEVPDGMERILINHARACLASFKLPKRIVVVDRLPKSTASKLLKRELRVQYAAIMG
jgi:fatty-acyl-CoA synthase